MIKSSWVACSWAVSTLVLVCAAAVGASAQAKITAADGRSVSVGGGLRTLFRTTDGPETGDSLKEFVLESARLYVNADVHQDISVEFNTEYGSADSTLRVMDAVVKYAPSPYFNVWMGRHLPPSDRPNLAGPYFSVPFDYPGLVSRYPSIFAGRDNGVLVNGQTGGGVFKYAAGLYEGAPNAPGHADTLLYAARLAYNFLDPEPGYYNNDTYFGDKTLLAVGFAAQHQADVVLVGGSPEAFTGMNGDLLFETKLAGGGVVTFEAAAYHYDLGGATGDGNSFLTSLAYLFPKTGMGAFQPMVRVQDFEGESALDVGVNYIIRGHSARLAAIYTRSGPESSKGHRFMLGVQLQF